MLIWDDCGFSVCCTLVLVRFYDGFSVVFVFGFSVFSVWFSCWCYAWFEFGFSVVLVWL